MSEWCEFRPETGTQRWVCINCGFRTSVMRRPPSSIRRKCNPGRKPRQLPSTTTQVVRYLSAVERWRLAGQPERTDDHVREILETCCIPCEYFERGRCTHSNCGCNVRAPEEEQETLLGRFVHRGLSNKLRMATERCPLGKWLPTTPVQVCFASPVWAVGGVEQWLLTLADAFDPARVKIVRIVVTSQGGLDQDALKWVPQDIEIIESPTIVDDGSFDLLLTWGQLELVKLIANLRCPVIDVQHGVLPTEVWQMPLVREAVRARERHGITLAAVNELARRNFPEDVRPHVVVIPNGVNPDRVKPTGKTPIALPAGSKVALFVGRVSSEKNVQVLVDAVNHLGDPWRAIIAGPLRTPLERITDRIHVLGPVREVGDVLAMADVLVHPSSFESHGLAVNEAWIAGLPVVSCSYPVNRQFEERHGPLMWLVPVGPTAEQLAAAILQADRDDPRVGRAREVALREYTAQVMAERWGELIWSVCRKTVPQTAPGTI